MNKQKTLESALYKHFGYKTFRTGQKKIIQDIIKGNDVLGVLPTGTGKSLCYQLPAKLLQGATIVVSPLISLMIDQVKQLKASQFKQVIALNSFMDPIERKNVYLQLHTYKLIYVSPELLQQNDLIVQLKKIQVSLFVIDEAHCISQWGHEFRPDYLKLGEIIQTLHNPTILALSATANHDVQNDIVTFIGRPKMIKHIYPMDRTNITFSIKEITNDREKVEVLEKLFNRYHFPALIYFSSRQSTETISSILKSKLPNQRIAFYHGGMEQVDRIAIQQQFMNNQLDIICCTSAFGMGINKKNIRLVVHFHFPPQIESYIQEIGRAGRDGKSSVAILLYSKKDDFLPTKLIKKELPATEHLHYVFRKLQQLYREGEQIPKTIEQLENIFQLGEIQWRFLRYQLEKHAIIEGNKIYFNEDNWKVSFKLIQDFIDERISIKERKLHEMIDWINEKNCLRKSLYKSFQDSINEPIYECCSNCGFSFIDWKPENTESDKSFGTWQEKLQTLLLIGDSND
ncbi:RecQ family ATP-dependent DNA helicase [Virgibacillus oceani]|uniref:ATP-dependent DNA helicase RecQ n=1 Tax=Virgibacillus oceani TaxID=1479511 RepID=A0A917LY97_9BACI|nr:ATP-dependent DNA helicase RecQ [Virgibacillus oceani]GGG65038.1 ATP-dependent DNA helicase RecQ [Virgibacillus oceani]